MYERGRRIVVAQEDTGSKLSLRAVSSTEHPFLMLRRGKAEGNTELGRI